MDIRLDILSIVTSGKNVIRNGNRMLMMSITDGCVTIPVICQMVWFK